MTDPITTRWPRPMAELPVARATRSRDDATAAALQAYLEAGRELPRRGELRL